MIFENSNMEDSWYKFGNSNKNPKIEDWVLKLKSKVMLKYFHDVEPHIVF